MNIDTTYGNLLKEVKKSVRVVSIGGNRPTFPEDLSSKTKTFQPRSIKWHVYAAKN